jgi:hypothetical protein
MPTVFARTQTMDVAIRQGASHHPPDTRRLFANRDSSENENG